MCSKFFSPLSYNRHSLDCRIGVVPRSEQVDAGEAFEPVPEPLVHLAPGVLALDLHRLVGVQAGHVGGLKENPPLLGFVEAVVPGDADVVLEGSGSDSSGSISDPEAEVAPAVRCPPLRNCLERYNGQGNWTGI